MNFHGPVKFTESYQDACDYSLQLNRWFLKMIGAWPRSAKTTMKERMISTLLIFTCYSLIAFMVVPYILHILLEETDLGKKLQAIGPVTHWSVSGINYFSLLFRAREIRHCMRHMKTDWRTVTDIEDRQVMLRYAKIGRVVTGLCAVFMNTGVISKVVFQGAMPTIVYIGNESVKIPSVPYHPYSKFMDIRYSPAGEIAFVLQLLSGFVVNFITVSACSLAAVFAMHACGQLNVLMRWLDQLVDDKNATQRLAIIVEHHLRVLSFVACMEALLNQICLVELFGCTLQLCMLGYYFITTWNIVDKTISLSFLIIYTSMAFNIFIFCYIGEVLTEQCKQVGEIAYMTNWYSLHYKTARALILIISRSSIVTKLTAGKLVHLSIATFATVIKTSMAYLNMLRTMTAL